MQMRSIYLVIQFLAFGIVQSQTISPGQSFNPEKYLVYRASSRLVIDGIPDEEAWENAPWTKDFRDIEGALKPTPAKRTHAKLLWDDTFLYIAAELDETDVWATLKQRDTVIFYDNDFEVFIDPDGDTHNYYEFEMNALNTVWDLLLLKPYRDASNVAINSWNINGIVTAVHVNGTLNHPGDTDKGWTVEIAMPWSTLKECAFEGRKPANGEQWRLGFSRVEWITDPIGGKYVKRTHVVNGKNIPLPENNWVWSPQGVIAMHQPETWGYIQFSGISAGKGFEAFTDFPDEKVKWALRQLYYRETEEFFKSGAYTSDLKVLDVAGISIPGLRFAPEIQLTTSFYEISHQGFEDGVVWHIAQDGRIWKTQK